MPRRYGWLGRWRRFSRAYAELHYQLRTEGDTPLRQSGAVWLGTVIGVIPIWGIHMALCVIFARMLDLSRIKTCLAAYVNNPVTFIPLMYASTGLGHWVFTGKWVSLAPDELMAEGLLAIGRDLFVGSLLLGLALGAVLAAVTYVISVRWQHTRIEVRMREAISRRYVDAGVIPWEIARRRLRRDPIYVEVLRSGILPTDGSLVDIGCGRGVLLSMVRTAIELQRAGDWPAEWPEPPHSLSLRGVESRRRPAAVARTALAGAARIELRSLSNYEPPRCHVVTLLDVLRDLADHEQEALVRRAAEALEPGGLMMLREVDASLGARFIVRRVALRIRSLGRGGWRRRRRFRTADEWVSLLQDQGLSTETEPGWSSATYGDVVIVAHKPAARGP